MPPEFDPTPGRAMIAAFAPGFAMPPEIEALAAALDEIERLRHDVDSLTTALAAPGKTIIIGSEEQAKRIAELEAALQIEKSAHEETKFSDAEKFCRDQATVTKQRAALKKLGQAKRERGKALVEERAKTTGGILCEYADDELFCAEREQWCDWESCTINNKARQKIREQLRAEGLL